LRRPATSAHSACQGFLSDPRGCEKNGYPVFARFAIEGQELAGHGSFLQSDQYHLRYLTTEVFESLQPTLLADLEVPAGGFAQGGGTRAVSIRLRRGRRRRIETYTSATYSEVGRHFGNRNHSTVVAGEKRVRQWLADNITLQLGKRIMPVADILEQIERKLGD
jgi:hypothetical protein